MEELILFFMSYVLIFILYQIFIIIPAKRRKSKKGRKDKEKEVIEVKYLETLYKIDIKKIKYEQLLQICALVSSFDISLTVTFVSIVDGLILELLVGFVSIVLLILVSYHLVYLFYKRKGLVKKETKENN